MVSCVNQGYVATSLSLYYDDLIKLANKNKLVLADVQKIDKKLNGVMDKLVKVLKWKYNQVYYSDLFLLRYSLYSFKGYRSHRFHSSLQNLYLLGCQGC